MPSRLFIKILAIPLLVIVLAVPLGMTSWILSDRVEQRATAVRSVQESTSGPQRLSGVVLVVPYEVRTLKKEQVASQVMVKGKPQVVMHTETRTVWTSKRWLGLPETYQITGDVRTLELFRGIYAVPTFVAKLRLRGTFKVDLKKLAQDPDIRLGQPYLGIGIGDVRGLRQAPTLTWNNRKYPVKPGVPLRGIASGVHAPLPELPASGVADYAFAMPLSLGGATRLSFTPMGGSAKIGMTSDWPHPSFAGRFLPVERNVTEEGFSATWQTTSMATGLSGPRAAADWSSLHDVSVAFVQPIDPYSQTERALKYAVLFLLLTFAVFFLFEVIRKLQIHPLQYGLVGCALAVFYLLLIALSEHLPFVTAYVVAAVACVSLIVFYVAHVLGGWQRALGFGGLLGGLYGALFGILRSEDYALLLGTTLVFGALAAVMVLTRRLDWYALGRRGGAAGTVEAGTVEAIAEVG